MAEFEEKLNQILSSPEAMGQIMSLANALSDSSESGGREEHASEGTKLPSTPSALGGLSGIGDMLGSLDPAMLSKLMTLFSTYQDGSDEKTRLLEAMKPFLRPERQSKLDRAMQITRLSRVIRSAMDLFKGDRDV